MLFTDEILEKILTREDVSKVPLVYQSAMIHAIKEIRLLFRHMLCLIQMLMHMDAHATQDVAAKTK